MLTILTWRRLSRATQALIDSRAETVKIAETYAGMKVPNLEKLVKKFTGISHLVIRNCMTNQEFRTIFKHLELLHSLRIVGVKIDFTGLFKSNTILLTEFAFTDCDQAEIDTRALGPALPFVKSLDFSGTTISDA